VVLCISKEEPDNKDQVYGPLTGSSQKSLNWFSPLISGCHKLKELVLAFDWWFSKTRTQRFCNSEIETIIWNQMFCDSRNFQKNWNQKFFDS